MIIATPRLSRSISYQQYSRLSKIVVFAVIAISYQIEGERQRRIERRTEGQRHKREIQNGRNKWERHKAFGKSVGHRVVKILGGRRRWRKT